MESGRTSGLHGGRGRAAGVWIVLRAAMAQRSTRRKPVCHQYHHQKSKPATPHNGIICGEPFAYEKLEEQKFSGPACARPKLPLNLAPAQLYPARGRRYSPAARIQEPEKECSVSVM